MNDSVMELARNIELVIFDIDGVFTDGSLYFDSDGEALKKFHVRDGHGIKILHAAGLHTAVISGRSSDIVSLRMAELGIQHVYQGCADKLPFFEALLKDTGIIAEHSAFVGDDIQDLPIMNNCGLAIAVADAHSDIIDCAHWCTSTPGGKGAVREVADMLITAKLVH